MRYLSIFYMGLLLVANAGLLLWGAAGFFEYFTGITPIIELQNAAYPSAVQFMHWLLITLTGGIFLIGYFSRWKWTAFAMVLLFSNLAVLCTIETFDFMSAQWSFGAYFTEIASYVAHSLFLLFSPLSKSRFQHFPSSGNE